MTYTEAKVFIETFLRGDHSNPTVTPEHFKAALIEVALRCEPSELIAEYDGTQTDVLRFTHSTIDEYGKEIKRYIKEPVVPNPIDDNAKIGIDNALHMAVVYFVCSYLSNKYKDRYDAKAKEVVSVYNANVIDE